MTVHRDGNLKLSKDQVILLFQSVRELLINSAKHAGTGKAAAAVAVLGVHSSSKMVLCQGCDGNEGDGRTEIILGAVERDQILAEMRLLNSYGSYGVFAQRKP